MKHYVSKEIAERLENIGFPIDKDKSKGFWAINANGDKYCTPSNGKEYIITPEMYEVQDWFRDKGLHIILYLDIWAGEFYYYYGIYKNPNDKTLYSSWRENIKSSYYEALEAGILKAIEIYESNIRRD